jgi:hypothetical protein
VKALYQIIIIFLLGSFITHVAAQASTDDKIISGDTLKWEYFTGKPDSTSNFWATTNWGVYYKYTITSFHADTIKINLKVWHVLKGNSWILPEKESDQLLHHEQGHFNLAILCEDEFKKAIDTTTFLMTGYDQKINLIFNSVLNNIAEMEKQYDKETNHMYNLDEQKQWDEKIKKMIKETE